MFRIGEFSKLGMVTVKSLRFYDEEGLLKPKTVDKWTGYRYYESEQLCDLHKIISLRQVGLSIVEIKNVISGADVQLILSSRQKELEKEISDSNERYLRITKLINSLKENRIMNFQATIKDLSECIVFYGVKKMNSFSDFNNFIFSIGEECKKANPTLKCETPDYCFISYLDDEFDPTDFTAMYAQAVEKKGNETKNVKFKTMPQVTVVSVLVKGEYSENLPLGYAFATNWIKEHGYEISDLPRESYIDGQWNVKSPDDYLTEIQIPIKKA